MFSWIEDGAKLPIEQPTVSPDYEVDVGMHIIVDAMRAKLSSGGSPPTDEQPIVTSIRPGRTNAAVVTKVHPDGSCDARFVCNCAAGWCEDAAAKATLGAPTCSACNAGGEARRVDSAQRQCS